MTTPTVNHLEAFKAFVAAQPSEQTINHMEGYKHCAIGAYGKSVGVVDAMQLTYLARDILSQFHDTTGRYISYVINVPRQAIETIPTYGKLSEFLNGAVGV